MKQVIIRKGRALLLEVPPPTLQPKNILVKVQYSCLSSGTERASLSYSKMSLIERALKQPHHVKRVLNMVKEEGLRSTFAKVESKLGFGSPTGYSASGIVVAVGEEVAGFSVGDCVACAGSGIANHAEYIDVPVHLAVKIPEAVSSMEASTVTIGAIALQGVRRADAKLGETVVVMGLGLIGLLTVQLLLANGCRVIGLDIREDRVNLAQQFGATAIFKQTPWQDSEILSLTEGMGADCVIVTAQSRDSELMQEAMRWTRPKGRVVIVGDVGLNLKRELFYQKELDVVMSCSYGPGRYDVTYELLGQDYPYPYVRWTENRNMQAYLQLIAQKKIQLAQFSPKIYALEEAEQAFVVLNGTDAPLLSYLEYSSSQEKNIATLKISSAPKAKDSIRLGIIGPGGFCQGVLLPQFAKQKGITIEAVASKSGLTALKVAQQYTAASVTTDWQEIILNPTIDAVVITTPHHMHGGMVLAALEAGKHVFVEKPLALTWKELAALEAYFGKTVSSPLLMTGFNRRFAPLVHTLKQKLKLRTTPLMAHYRVNAGYIDPKHWVHGPEGGGRNLGEACHFYDLFNYLVGNKPTEINATGIDSVPPYGPQDNFTVTLKYQDGSLCELFYTALGNRKHPKEHLEIYAGNTVYILDDYKSLTIVGSRTEQQKNRLQDKGHANEITEFIQGIRTGVWPIPLAEQLLATRIALMVEREIRPIAEGAESVCAELLV